jgi:hypothetical protein
MRGVALHEGWVEWCVDARMLVGVIQTPDKAVVPDPSTDLANTVQREDTLPTNNCFERRRQTR